MAMEVFFQNLLASTIVLTILGFIFLAYYTKLSKQTFKEAISKLWNSTTIFKEPEIAVPQPTEAVHQVWQEQRTRM